MAAADADTAERVSIDVQSLVRLAKPRAVLGVVQIATDLVMDSEGPAMAALLNARAAAAGLGRVEMRMTKLAMPSENICAETYNGSYANGSMAAALESVQLPAGYTTAYGFSCTSLSFSIGKERLEALMPPGAVWTDMWQGVLAALAALTARRGGKRVAMLTPYIPEVADNNAAQMRAHGYDVIRRMDFGFTKDELTSAVSPDSIADAAAALAADGNVDILFIGCSALRACQPGFITDLEQRLQKQQPDTAAPGPAVITSTQAFLWHMLRTAGVHDQLDGYGELFMSC